MFDEHGEGEDDDDDEDDTDEEEDDEDGLDGEQSCLRSLFDVDEPDGIVRLGGGVYVGLSLTKGMVVCVFLFFLGVCAGSSSRYPSHKKGYSILHSLAKSSNLNLDDFHKS